MYRFHAYSKFLLLVIIPIVIVSSCGKDMGVPHVDNPPPPPLTVNLIQNPSFEDSLGQPSLKYWYSNYGSNSTFWLADTASSDFDIVQDAPTGGGSWSLKLTGFGNSYIGHINSIVTGQTGTNIYELTVWAKCIGTCGGGGGDPCWNSIAMGTWGPPYVDSKCTALDTAKIWKKYSLIDTFSTQATDTVLVRFQLHGGGPCATWYKFDKVELKKINQ